VVVADAVTVRGHAERGHAFHETGGKSAQAAVAQRRVRLERTQAVEVHFQSAQRRARRLGDAKIAERIEEEPPDQELERKVVDPLAAVAIRSPRGVDPAVDDVVARDQGGRDEPVVIARMGRDPCRPCR
jgi:hypothetical protein